MIYGTKDLDKSICRWVDVRGHAENKHFVRAQVEKILPLIKEEFIANWKLNGIDTYSSLFIISPFRPVKAGVIKFFYSHNYLYHELCKSENLIYKKSMDLF